MDNKDEYERYIETEKKRNSPWARFLKNIKPIYIILFFIFISAGHYYNSIGKFPTPLYWGLIIAFVVIIFILINKPSGEPELIPEHIIKQIALNCLENKRLKGIEIPFDATVRVTLVGEPIYEQNTVFATSTMIKREVGFEVIKRGYRKTGVIGVHPYSGQILGIRWERTGYTGKESKDRIIVPVGIMQPSSLTSMKKPEV